MVSRVLMGRGLIQGSHSSVAFAFACRVSDSTSNWKANSSSFCYDFHTCLDKRHL